MRSDGSLQLWGLQWEYRAGGRETEEVEVCSGDKSNESLWSKTRIHVCGNEKEALLTVKMHEVEAVKMLKGRTVHKRGQEASAGRVELGVVEMSAWNNLWQKDSSKTEREDVQEWDLVCIFFFKPVRSGSFCNYIYDLNILLWQTCLLEELCRLSIAGLGNSRASVVLC